MNKIVLLIMLLSIATIYTGCGSSCDSSHQQAVASLFAAAYTNPRGFVNYVQEHPEWFDKNSQWRKCLDELSTELMKSALTAPSSDNIRESAYSIASRAGASHLGDDLYNDMMNSKLDMYSLANYLNLLGSVTHEITNGNVNAYYNSPFYIVAKIFGNMDTKFIKMMYDLMYWYVFQFAQQI